MSKGNRLPLFHEFGLEVRRHQNATDTLDELVVERLGINRTDGRCLDVIDQHGAMTAGELATATGLSPGAITNILDRMEHAGYLKRVRDPGDRRKITVQLTPEASKRLMEIFGPIMCWSEAELSRYTDEQIRFVMDFLRRGRVFMEEYVAKVRASPAGTTAKPRKRSKRRE
jgi:DNA-binding MarR family transcriptional regulator